MSTKKKKVPQKCRHGCGSDDDGDEHREPRYLFQLDDANGTAVLVYQCDIWLFGSRMQFDGDP